MGIEADIIKQIEKYQQDLGTAAINVQRLEGAIAALKAVLETLADEAEDRIDTAIDELLKVTSNGNE